VTSLFFLFNELVLLSGVGGGPSKDNAAGVEDIHNK